MQFLELVLKNKVIESSSSSTRIVVEVRRSIDGVFSEVEVTREDSVSSVVVSSERIDFSKPVVTVRAMKVEIDNTEAFTC
jgi:hypothetical protein